MASKYSPLAASRALAPPFRLDGRELLVQLKLLGERLAQRLVVVDDEDLLACDGGHPHLPLSACNAPARMVSPAPRRRSLSLYRAVLATGPAPLREALDRVR